MLALRTTLRCNSAFNKISRNTYKSLQLIQTENNATLSTAATIVTRNTSRQQLQKQPALLNGYLMQRRSYASKSSEEVDVKDLQLVYYGTLTPRMRAVKVFSLTTSLAGLAAQPILMEQGMKMGGTGMAVFLCSFAGFFTFVTPLLLHFVTKKYVTEIHYNPMTEEYVATTINIILQKVRTKFRPSDVKIPEVPGMFTSFNVGKRSLFVDPALFEDPEHYVKIMGYDKPIDFKLDLKETDNSAVNATEKSKK
ncbi:transmembrane protein 70 homolog, mitochondrial [Lucilia cuprina]|uniref:transmembrane protein 70 homolog, mitochondrial n=1 Tax=Lucilia cuprina TaxID=7375 RepID=UPI001F053797|nr:transmembrane protein 70 homolog, mitochondrial [Lucilia cuprina]